MKKSNLEINEEYNDCFIACKDATYTCLSTYKKYSKDNTNNIDTEFTTMLLECSKLCDFVANMIALDSDYIEIYLDVCIFICEECIDECIDLEGQYFKECIIACEKCINECKKLIHD